MEIRSWRSRLGKAFEGLIIDAGRRINIYIYRRLCILNVQKFTLETEDKIEYKNACD